MEVEAVSLIVGALAAGASRGLQETASAAVKDSYTRLRDLVTSRFSGHRQAETALEGYAEDPETWQKPLEKSLQLTGVAADPSVLEAARSFMSLLDAEDVAGGRFVVHINDSSGVQVNQHGGNVQVNTFNS
jgi:hypothetical protein